MRKPASVSSTFRKQFRKSGHAEQARIRTGLADLADRELAQMDIKLIRGSDPSKRRLRVGRYLIIFYEGLETIQVIEVFKRGRG